MRTVRSASSSLSLSDHVSPELQALLACARERLGLGGTSDLQTALDACESVERLCDASVRQNMLGNLHRAIVTDRTVTAASTLTDRLSELQREAALRGLRQTARLLQILDALEAAGVEAMPYKGPVWAQRLYGDVVMRTWVDLDLLVRHSDVLSARRVLLDHGFVDSNAYNERITRRSKGSLGQIALYSADAHANVDLHWEVTVGISSRSLDPASMFARSESLDLLGSSVPCPDKTDALLLTCLEGARDRWDTVEKLLGLGLQVEGVAANEWPEILIRAREAGCLRRVCVGVHYVCSALGLNKRIGAIEEALAHDRVSRSLAVSLGPGSMSERPARDSLRHLSKLLWGFASEDQLLTAMGHAGRRLFQPGPEDWSSYSLPKYLEWLYGPLRPARLALKWSVRLTRRGSRERDRGIGRQQGSV